MSLLREKSANTCVTDLVSTNATLTGLTTVDVYVGGGIQSTRGVNIPNHLVIDAVTNSPALFTATAGVLVDTAERTTRISAAATAVTTPPPSGPGLFIQPVRGAPLADLLGFKPMYYDPETAELVYDTLGQSSSLTFLRQEHLNAVNGLLYQVAAVPTSAPTTTSRLSYLLAMLVAVAWNLVSPSIGSGVALPPTPSGFPSSGTIRGSHDDWDFDVRVPQSSDDATVWVVGVLLQFLPLIVTAYDTDALLARERLFFDWTPTQQVDAHTRVKGQVGWPAFVDRWNTWWASRQSDGFNDPTTGAYVATSADLPNVATPLVVTSSDDPGSSGKWTPLKLASGAVQNYLGYKWSQVRSTSLSAGDESSVYSAAAPLFIASTDPAKGAEVHDVYVTSAALSDAQKMSAEFWAGGPHTSTPCGMFAWLWADYVRHYIPSPTYESTTGETDAQTLAFLHLSVNLFEGSRLVWGVKSLYAESRPIQEVRHRFRGDVQPDTVTGVLTDASLWVPYQPSNVVTPRFADFPSGHTYFSACFARTMTYWFGAEIRAARLPLVDAPYTHASLSLLSPLFLNTPDTQTTFGTFRVAPGSSDVQPGVTPTAQTTLDWSASTWARLAEDVGLSRFYGGIHAMSAYYGSLAVCDALTPILQSKWQIATSSIR